MKPVITDIAGVGPVAAEALAEYRISTLTQLARATVTRVAAVPGFSEARAAKVIAAAAELLGTTATTPTAEEAAPRKTTGKGKDRKKDKKKDKDKDKKKGKNKGKDKKKGKDKGKNKGKGKGKGKKRKKNRK
jgi:hypothetical protein